MTTKYWLMKSEPSTYSIDDLEREEKTGWDGIRNYQARNFMRDEMRVKDKVLFYHSNAKPPGVVGMAEVCRLNIPDHTAFDPTSPYYDPKSLKENPRWIMVEVKFLEKFPRMVSLQELKEHPDLKDLIVIQKGSRLSIQPVTQEDFERIQDIAYQNV